MAYDEATYRRQSDDDGEDPAAYRSGLTAPDYRGRRRDLDPDSGYADAQTEPLRRTSPYDDDGRDRLGFHIGWEIVLLLAVAAIAPRLYRPGPGRLGPP